MQLSETSYRVYNLKCCAWRTTETIGCHATNDGMAESVYGAYKYERLRNPGISQRRASGLAQTRIMKSFATEDAVQHRAARKPAAANTASGKRKRYKSFGYFYSLPYTEQVALLEMARVQRSVERELDRKDQEELDAFRAARRKSNSDLELESLVKQFALALSFYDRYKVDGACLPSPHQPPFSNPPPFFPLLLVPSPRAGAHRHSLLHVGAWGQLRR